MINEIKALFAGPKKEEQDSEAPSKDMLDEIAWTDASFFGSQGKFESFNPDLLVGHKGEDIYRKMLRDPQVKSAFNLVLSILVSRRFRFEKDADNPLHDDMEAFFRHNIEVSLRGNWKQTLKAILMAKAWGFSVNEKVYKVDQYEGKDKWMIASINPKPFHTFYYQLDNFGNILNIYQEFHGNQKELDPRKFILFLSHPELDPIWGESDLRSSYRAYWEKDNILKFWNIYLERLAGGFPVVTTKDNAPTLGSAEKTQFDNILKNLSAGSSMRLPRGFEIDIVSPAATDAFEKAIKHKDAQIAKSLLVPNLLGFSEQGATGSFAQSKTQLSTFFFVVLDDGDRLAETLNEQFFRELAVWNFGTDDFPRFRFEPFTDDQKREIAEAWVKAVKDGVVVNTFYDELRTRELLLYDKREEELEDPDPDPEKQEEPPEEPDPDAEETAKESDNSQEADRGKGDGDRTGSPGDVPSFTENSNSQKFIDRVSFQAIEDFFDNTEARAAAVLGEAVDQAFQEVSAEIAKIVPRVDKDAEPQLEGFVKDLNNSISKETKAAMNKASRDFVKEGYEEGRKQGQDEIEEAVEDVPENMKQKLTLAAKCSRRLAVKFDRINPEPWTVSSFVEGIPLDTAEKYFASKAFWITGILNDTVLNASKTALLNGIRDELSVPEIMDELTDILEPVLGKKDPVTGQPDPKLRARIETTVRTNLTDSFNQARMAVFTDPELGDFVEALMYSSIVDSRTTDFCRRHDNRTYPISDPVWKGITPPNHFSCRSLLIPVTVVDEWKESEKLSISPAKGFGRTIDKGD